MGSSSRAGCCVVALGIDTDEALLRLDRRHLADYSRLQPRLLKR
jgi:hypothetical protein